MIAAAMAVATAETQPIRQAANGGSQTTAVATIPGPLTGLMRMAAISTKVSSEQVLPFLARNVFTHGYEGWGSDRQPTEYLVLLRRYLQEARELRSLAGNDGVIRVPSCDQAGKLLAVLGYRLRKGCGNQASLETADASRAFVTLYSAFPLTELEDALRSEKSFSYEYPSTEVPMLFTREDWLGAGTSVKPHLKDDLLDALVSDVSLARLYWAMSRLDNETRETLRTSFGVRRLLPYAATLDFYGGEISIRSGRVLVPGGAAAESTWQHFIGVSPQDGANFALQLMTRDSGWPAALFDELSRSDAAHQRYFSEPSRLERFYGALRGHGLSPGPAHAVFRSDTATFLLLSRLPLGDDGRPSVPGNVEVWNRILHHDVAGSPAKTADDLVSVLFRLAFETSKSGTVELYLLLGEIDHARGEHLSPETVRLLAEKYARYRDQYSIFCEFRSLSDQSMQRFLAVAESLDRIRDVQVRTDAIGSLQANVGIWEILARQGEITRSQQNESWQKTISPFYKVHSSTQLFDAARTSLRALLRAAGGNADSSQDEVISLLAGPAPSTAEGRSIHQQLEDDIRSVMIRQRLVPLDTLFGFSDGLNDLANRKTAEALLPMAETLREFEMPRPLFTRGERSEWASGINTGTTHDEAQTRTDWVRLVTTPKSRADIEKARGRLAPILRDSLVGLNYGYYAPPGAQMVHNNALFVRSHDFSGTVNVGGGQSWQTPMIMGSGVPAARGARLVGSLAELPYVLAQVEQDFVVPENAQALMLNETAPTLMLGAVVPRWWRVSQRELHAVALFQRAGEELLRSAAKDEQTRKQVMGILTECMFPARAQQFQDAANAGASDSIPELAPFESFYLANQFQRRFPRETPNNWGPAGHELEALLQDHPEEVSWERLSQDFGVPHPALAHTYALTFLMFKPSPTIMDYGSRLFAESWQSNNLYWARLADEQGYSPVVLNRLVPRLTRRMLEKIFATDLADWPALLRALQETGDEFRRGSMETKTASAVAQQ